jgi:hypothetical protein
MKLFPTPKSGTVAEWLELATNRLAPAARARIGVEIEAHFAEAMEAHRQAGMSETAARTAALAELGDAWAAARRFRKQHLTVWEAQEVEAMAANARSVFRLVLAYVWFALFLLGAWSSWNHDWWHYPRFLACLTASLVVCIVIPTKFYLHQRLKRAGSKTEMFFLLSSVSGRSLSCYALCLLPTILATPHSEFELVCIGLMAASHTFGQFHLWHKLRRVGYFRSTRPPHDAVIS